MPEGLCWPTRRIGVVAIRRVLPAIAIAACPVLDVEGAASPPSGGALRSPIDTTLGPAADQAATIENLTVTGRQLRYRLAPTPNHAGEVAPWDAARAIRDPGTGADTTVFGNAFNLGDPMGSDERSNETGGTMVAPRHP